MKYAIALDIGGTSIKYTLVNQNGDILYESSETTQSKENPRPLSDTIKSIVRKMTDYARSRDWGIYGIGIGVPSVVDKGVVLFANNLPELDNQQLDLALAEFNLPVFIDNDANLMGLGEVIYGAAKGLRYRFPDGGYRHRGRLVLERPALWRLPEPGHRTWALNYSWSEWESMYLRSVRLPRGTRFRKCVDRLIPAIIGEERTRDTFPYRWKIYSRAL